MVVPTSQRAQAHTNVQTELGVSPAGSSGIHTLGSCGIRVREVRELIRELGSVLGDVGICFGLSAVRKWGN